MEKKSFEKSIGVHKDFPKKGIIFRDIMPLLREPVKFDSLIDQMSRSEICNKADAILAIDSRGFLFGTGIALKLLKPLIVARKPGKLPGELISNSYSLEYGENSLSIQKEAIKDYKSFVIVDDLLATGGTVECVSKLLYSENKQITGLVTVIELSSLQGRLKLDFPVISQITY